MARKKAKTEKGQPSDEFRSLPPSPNQRRLPLFDMHDEDFEEILAEVAEKEPGIVRAELKRTSGVAQYGVDVEGFSEEQQSVLVILGGEIRAAGKIPRNASRTLAGGTRRVGELSGRAQQALSVSAR
jgi:hypothetical protein